LDDVRVVESAVAWSSRFDRRHSYHIVTDDGWVVEDAAGVYAVMNAMRLHLAEPDPCSFVSDAISEACRAGARPPLRRVFDVAHEATLRWNMTLSMVALRPRGGAVEVARAGVGRIVLYRGRSWHELLEPRRLAWNDDEMRGRLLGAQGSPIVPPEASIYRVVTNQFGQREFPPRLDVMRFVPRAGDVVLLASPGVFGHTDEYLWWPSRVLRAGGTLAQRAEAIVAQTAQLAPTKDRAVVLVGF
jgi:hypothetical protein